MPDLNDIIGAVLRDMSEGQDTANRYSADLARQYSDDPLLGVMSVPNALLSDLELELKYAIQHVVNEDLRPEQRRRLLSDAVKSHVLPVAEAALEQVQRAFAQRDGSSAQDGKEDGKEAKEAKDGKQGEEWRALHEPELSLHMAQELQEQLLGTLALLNEEGLDQAKCREITLSVLHKHLGRFLPESQGQAPAQADSLSPFEEDTRATAALVSAAVGAFIDALTASLKQPVDTSNNRKLDVVVDSKVLQSVPRELLCTVKVRANLRNYKWTVVSNADETQKHQLLIREDN